MLGIIKHVKDRLQGKAGKGVRRSSQWPKVRKEHLKRYPSCAMCGGTRKVEVHHVMPFNMAPELELNPMNLISLCETKSFGVTCHLFFGHCGNYKRANDTVHEDVARWRQKIVVARDHSHTSPQEKAS